MSPEFGSTCAIFPVDAETLRYLDLTGRPTETIELVDAYAREQGMFHRGLAQEPTFSDMLELELGDVVPSIAGPKRPQDRVPLVRRRSRSSRRWRIRPDAVEELGNGLDEANEESFPASDPPAEDHDDARGKPRPAVTGSPVATVERRRSDDAIEVTVEGETFEFDHGRVVIAAITSCTNTSNPSVMIGAGLLARNALAKGLTRKPWVKTSLAPGSTVVTDYLRQAGLDESLDALQFNLVGYGCTTCIGNSGPLAEEISAAIDKKDLAVCAVLSGNRNFEGRINQDVKANYLAARRWSSPTRWPGGWTSTSPPSRSARAPAASRSTCATSGPRQEIKQVVGDSVAAEMYERNYADVFTGDEEWQAVDVPEGDRTTGPTRPTCAGRASSRTCQRTRPASPRSGRPRTRRARRLGHHRPHLARRRDQKDSPAGPG